MLQRLKQSVLRRAGRYFELPLERDVELNTSSRPHYAYCVYHAARLALRLHIPGISVLEFGVAGWNGLVFLERFASRVARTLGVAIEVYGFDTGVGLPSIKVCEDLPYWFDASQYAMDEAALRARLQSAELVLGDVEETVPRFIAEYHPAPVAVILNDLDLYTSTANSLNIFRQNPCNFLPRVFMYFDDIVGDEFSMYNSRNGQLRAISEFNRNNSNVHIGLNRNLLPRSDIFYRYQIYYAHLWGHSLYAKYIGGESQSAIESSLKLKA